MELVKQLRQLSAENPSPRDCIDEAADEIERLREVAAAVRGLSKIKGGKTLFEQSPTQDPECARAWLRLNDAMAALTPNPDVLKQLMVAQGYEFREETPKRDPFYEEGGIGHDLAI